MYSILHFPEFTSDENLPLHVLKAYSGMSEFLFLNGGIESFGSN